MAGNERSKKEVEMFYATHICGKELLVGIKEDKLVARGVSLWSEFCSRCNGIVRLEMKDLTIKYAGVEVISFEGNEPEYQALNMHLEATLRIDGELYVFLTEHSGNRGTYPQWSKNWVSKPISRDVDGSEVIPNTHKCGSRYWNDHCWFQLKDFNSLEQVVAMVRENASEIARRAADTKYHAG